MKRTKDLKEEQEEIFRRIHLEDKRHDSMMERGYLEWYYKTKKEKYIRE